MKLIATKYASIFEYFNSRIQTAVLSMIYITALSYGLVVAGITIHESKGDALFEAETYDKLFFAGSFIAALAWVS